MSHRVKLATRLYEEGLAEIERLGLVRHDPDRFFTTMEFRTGMTDGARGGIRAHRPFIYIGRRCREFDRTTAERKHREWAKRYKGDAGRVWKLAVAAARDGQWMYTEYSHIHDDPEIGGFTSDHSEDHVRAVVAHELAHAIHWWHIKNDAEYDGVSHGAAWRRLYRILRREWVNPARNKSTVGVDGVGHLR